jgi:hypothetical protein
MWMLAIVLLNTMPGIPTVTVLQTYPTSQECHSERERIGDEMAKAYPMGRTSRLPVGSIHCSNHDTSSRLLK